MRIRSGIRQWPRVLGTLAACFAFGVGGEIRAKAEDETQAKVVLTGTVVDEAKTPVAGVAVTSHGTNVSEPVITAADGNFRIEAPSYPSGLIGTTLRAAGVDGQLGLLRVSQEKQKLEPVTIVLKPARALEVRVVDRAGKPVKGAEVGFLESLTLLEEGRTDADGRWVAKVPDDAKAWGVYALKAKKGFDFAIAQRARRSAEPLLPLPEQLTLTLDGARAPVRIKAVDKEGKPLANVKIGPWIITKPGHEAEINLGGLSKNWATTGKDGTVTFDWLPERATGTIAFLTRSPTSYSLDQVGFPADQPTDELTIPHFPYEQLSGRITTPDGRPAAGVDVRIEGRGDGNRWFRRQTTTGADGRYTCSVYSEQAYIITASKAGLAAPYKSGVIVRAGKPVDGVDLTLVRATRVRGRVTVGKDRKPVASTWVQAVIESGSIPAKLLRADSRNRNRELSLSLRQQTDQDGRYELLLGPGEYSLRGPARVAAVKLTIPLENPPAELVRDFAMPRPATGPFKLTVVDTDDRPVAGAVVRGRPFVDPFITNAQGTVSLNRSLDRLMIHVETADKSRAGVVRISAEATEARVVLKPTASATGRLVDLEGKPLTGPNLSYQIRIFDGPNLANQSGRLSDEVSTADGQQGGFTCAGLVVGETYKITIFHEDERRYSDAKTVIEPAGPHPIALGDIPVDLNPPKPYVPPTPAERTSASFAARNEKSPQEKRDYILTEAKREYTRPLLLFGAPKDPACVELFRLFQERLEGDDAANGKPRVKSPADLRWEFELASLDTAKADVLPLAQDLGVSFGDEKRPILAVLSDEGKLAATYPLRLGADKTLDARELGTFLLEHKLATRDAEVMLADGLAKAKAEDKRVFLIMSASWCGPCRLLARFLAANKEELQRHYVFVKLDVSRDAHAETLRKRYKGAESGGVPWFVILDSSGAPLITSNAKELAEDESSSTNIGFPSSKEAIDHFAKMLKQTAPRLSGEALATLRERLSTKP